MLTATGIVYLGKQRPQTSIGADGTWSVTLRVVDRTGVHERTPWLLVFSGEPARAWWALEGHMAEAGDGLQVELERIRLHEVARDRFGSTTDATARAMAIKVVSKAHKAEAAAS